MSTYNMINLIIFLILKLSTYRVLCIIGVRRLFTAYAGILKYYTQLNTKNNSPKSLNINNSSHNTNTNLNSKKKLTCILFNLYPEGGVCIDRWPVPAYNHIYTNHH